MKNIFNLMDQSIKELKGITIYKKSDFQEVVDIIIENEQYLNEYKERLKEIDSLPYYKKFARFGEQKKDINFCLDGISEVKNDLISLYKKLGGICTFEIIKLKK